jgi:LacI family transcriptional regulator
MASKMTIYDFAKQIGLSTGTVSRAIHNRPDVSPTTRARVLAKMHELGFQPSAMARALSTGRSRVVSIWVPGLTGSFATTFLRVIWQHLWRYGYEMNMWDTSANFNPEEMRLRSPGVLAEGIIILDRADWVHELFKEPRRMGVPVVSVGSYYETGVDYVGVDLSYGAQEATRHLIQCGCKRVAYLVPEGANTSGDARYDAYLASVTKAEMQPEVICVPDATRTAAMQTLQAYVAARGHPDGLFCFNDDYALAAYRMLRELGIKVPEDVALIGCDGIEDIEYLERPLSTIHIPLDELCELAWEFLNARMKNPAMPQQRLVLVPKLVIRESSRR